MLIVCPLMCPMLLSAFRLDTDCKLRLLFVSVFSEHLFAAYPLKDIYNSSVLTAFTEKFSLTVHRMSALVPACKSMGTLLVNRQEPFQCCSTLRV
jgi:hypothetical protein